MCAVPGLAAAATTAFSSDKYRASHFQYAGVSGEWGSRVSPTVALVRWINTAGQSTAPGEFALELIKNSATATVASSSALVDVDPAAKATALRYSCRTGTAGVAGAARFNATVTHRVASTTYALGRGDSPGSGKATLDDIRYSNTLVGEPATAKHGAGRGRRKRSVAAPQVLATPTMQSDAEQKQAVLKYSARNRRTTDARAFEEVRGTRC